MKASELRKGNYITQDGELIAGITTNSIHKFDIGQIVLEPIPLTEEWLTEKFGFEIDRSFLSDDWPYVDFVKDGLRIELPYFTFTWNDGENQIEVKTVNQLQNLYYSLTGEELEVKS